MCGIVGYIGDNNVKNNLLNGLKALEYRGYDSSGICLGNKKNLKIYKSIGKVDNLIKQVKNVNFNSSFGIAHTRWATHGKVSLENCHPQRYGDVILVHNGIIENYKSLLKDVTLQSQTDSEYIAALLSKENGENISKINNVIKKLEGTFALAIIFEEDKEHIYVTKRSCPLAILKSDFGNYISSDIGAYINDSSCYTFLDDDEIAVVSKNNVKIYNRNLEIIQKEFIKSDLTTYKPSSSLYSCYMEKEIYEQPDVIKKTINNIKKIPKLNLKKYKNITVCACGSALYAGNCFKYLAEEYLSIPINIEIASEFRYKKILIPDNSLMIFVSQSGETADTIASLKIAKEKNIETLAICNTPLSTIARIADNTIYTLAGSEISVATTKAYTAQIATFMSIILNELEDNTYLLKEFNKLPNILEVILNDLEKIKEIAKKIYKKNDVFYIGRNIDNVFCQEGSLKLKEISYIHSESYPAGELKHGSISLINENTPVICIATYKKTISKTLNNLEECKTRGAFTILISDLDLENNADIVYKLPPVDDFFIPITTQVVLQLIAFYTATYKKVDIDKPRNLAKSVTVE